MLIVFVAFSYFTSLLTTPSVEESNFRPSHMLSSFFNDVADYRSVQPVSRYLVLDTLAGIQDVQRDSFYRFSSDENRGKAVFDGNLDLADPLAQAHLLNACQTARTYPCDLEGCDLPTLFYPDLVDCWLEDFQEFYNETFSVSSSQDGAANPTRWYATLHAWSLQQDPSRRLPTYIGFENSTDTLLFVGFKSTMSLLSGMPVKLKGPVLDHADAYLKEILTGAPGSLNSLGFFRSSFKNFSKM